MGGLDRRPRSLIEISVMMLSCVETQNTAEDDISSPAEQPLPGQKLLYMSFASSVAVMISSKKTPIRTVPLVLASLW